MQKAGNVRDEPDRCRDCSFWKGKRKGCVLADGECPSLNIILPKPEPKCGGCPYGRNQPCIGWCTLKIMQELGLR